MIYKKAEILRRLSAVRDAEALGVKREHEAALARADKTALHEDINRKMEELHVAHVKEQWPRMSKVAYDVYNLANRAGEVQPNFSNRDHHQRKVDAIDSMMSLLSSTDSEKVSTSELKDLGVLALIRHVP